MARSQTLTIMFTDIAGFTARTSQQSRAENAAMLKAHDDLLLPIVSHFGGRRIKSIGDALLVVFTSPTDAVRCGMAVQDALHAHNKAMPPEGAMHVRVALNQGEVRVEKGDVFGEPVNIAARIEALTPADEVYFSESVYLAMTKAEVPNERVGTHELKGIPEPVTVYRVVPFKSGDTSLPFGGLHRSVTARGQAIVHATAQARAVVGKLPPRKVVPVVAAVALVGLLAVLVPRACGSVRGEAEQLLAAGRIAEADAKAQERLVDDPNDPEALLVSGHVAFARGNRQSGIKAYERALAADGSLRDDPRLVRNLVDALTSVGKPAQDVLVAYPNGVATSALVERSRQPGYWGRRRANEVLAQTGEGDRIDEEQTALADLKEAPDCSQRLAAVKKVREHETKAALPQLKELASDGFINSFKNGCLQKEAAETIKALE
ncbi:MAG: adenylate/guanylate cyclase domain-containing protein [Myxococcota bacterium]|nr:adenylate/guanylate cyclase domain-containing protein [Myxococcota bacterium]